MEDQNKHIAERIKSIRLNKNMSQSTIANALNLTVTAYNRIENNKTQLTINNLYKIAEALDVSVERILELANVSHIYNTKGIVMTNLNQGTLNFSIDIDQLEKLMNKS